MSESPFPPIAIVGMSGRFPGAASLEAFWANLRAGVDCLTNFTDTELEAAGVDAAMRARPGWVARGTVLEDVDLFDAAFFGYSPREAQVIDPQQRVFLECAWEALDHAGYGAEAPGTSVGVYAGSSLNSYLLSQLLPDRSLLASVGGYQLMIGNDKDFLCTRASYKLDLHGPSMTIQTACSTSLVAVQVACRSLQRGECDMALAGGVSIGFPQRTGYQFQEGMIFSPDGVCRPFDVQAQGTRAGAGAGIVVLKRLQDALADRDTIYAVIKGAAVNNDGAGKAGYTAPSVDGQMEAIATAQALAGVAPRSITYLEAHGTATPLGDPIEIAALTQVFRASTAERQFCALGSLKANLGHLDAAAGVAGLIKATLALGQREIPPLAHFQAPNPRLELESSPFRVPTVVEPWSSSNGPRRAGVSSFGIGGSNAHVVLEEAPELAPSVSHRAQHLLVLSARTAQALDAATTNLRAHLGAHPSLNLADVAYTLQLGRRAFPHRRALVAHDVAEAIVTLAAPERAPVLSGVHEGAARPVAFLFSGQGSQHAGMCWQLYQGEPVLRAAIDSCAALLRGPLGCDIRDLLREGTDAQLSETRLTQPLLFVTEYALAMLWMAWGVQPAAMLGHSIGEYVAAHLAGVFSLADALTLVAARGRLMQALAPGEMLAVSLPAAELGARLRPGVEIAAVNAPALCSVSGAPAAIAELAAELTLAGIEHRRLHTSHAFHSAMMQPALAPFREVLARVLLSAPSKRYVSNVTGTWIRPEQATSPDYYLEHLRGSVLFAAGVATLSADPSLMFLEVGPGTALASLARLSLGREGAARVIASLPHPREQRAQLDAVLTATAKLWLAGVAVNWAGVHADEQLHRIALPAYPFERKRHWVDPPALAAAPATTPGAPEDSAAAFRREDLKDWFHLPTWERSLLGATGRRSVSGTWLVFGAQNELTSELCTLLRAAGGEPVLVRAAQGFSAEGADSYALRPDADADYAELLGALAGRRLSGVLHLWNAVGAEHADAARPLHELMALARALLTVPEPLRVVIATTGAQSVLGEPISAPSRALVAGVVLALPAEREGLQLCALDLSEATDALWSKHAAQALLEELSANDSEPFVAQRSRSRWVRRYAEMSLPALEQSPLPLKPQGVYLITGGAGGIGLTLAHWIAARVQARFILTARTPLPPRDSWDAYAAAHEAADPTLQILKRVRELEASGSEVLVVAADIADEAAMRRVVEEARARWGGVDGVIHAAGVAGGSALAFSEPAETEAVLRSKVLGTRVLAQVLGATPLDFCVLFSSISAVVGAAGGCAYGAACAYLDAYVLSSHKPAAWRQVLSIAWDAWRDVGMAERVVVPAAMREARRAYVNAGIPPLRGAEAFGRALASGLPQYVVSPLEVGRVLGALRRAATIAANAPTTSASGAAGSASPPRADSASGGDVEALLTAMWEELLGVRPVGANDNFFELGGHSLLATRILARIDEQFAVRLPLRVMFDAPTVGQLAELVSAQRGLRPAATSSEPAGEREEFEL
ncbi:MAG: SDR family NAD(P)-dependent oxidoreductase [Pseudomonadota bacterium]